MGIGTDKGKAYRADMGDRCLFWNFIGPRSIRSCVTAVSDWWAESSTSESCSSWLCLSIESSFRGGIVEIVEEICQVPHVLLADLAEVGSLRLLPSWQKPLSGVLKRPALCSVVSSKSFLVALCSIPDQKEYFSSPNNSSSIVSIVCMLALLLSSAAVE